MILIHVAFKYDLEFPFEHKFILAQVTVNRRQAITWSNVDLDLQHPVASLCHNDLKYISYNTKQLLYLDIFCSWDIKMICIQTEIWYSNLHSTRVFPLCYLSFRHISLSLTHHLKKLYQNVPSIYTLRNGQNDNHSTDNIFIGIFIMKSFDFDSYFMYVFFLSFQLKISQYWLK